MVIMARKPNYNVTSSQMSLVAINSKTIRQLSYTMGTKDLIKSMTLMPGIKSVGEFGTGINVRDGGSDQNLILIEGSPVFNTAHVLGLLSVISADAIEGVIMFKGDIPSKYGERVTSVMDIELKKNNFENFLENLIKQSIRRIILSFRTLVKFSQILYLV